MINLIKSIRKFQIAGIKHTQLSVFFNASTNTKIYLSNTLSENTWYYLSKSGKVKTIQIEGVEYSFSCILNGKVAHMAAIEINGKLTPVFQPVGKEFLYVDLISIPEY